MTRQKVLAAAAACMLSCTAAALPIHALPDAYEQGYLQIMTQESTEGVYSGVPYVLTNADQLALGMTTAGDYAPTAATIDPDGTYYAGAYDAEADAGTYLSWTFTAAADGASCHLRPEGNHAQYLAAGTNGCTLTENVNDALSFKFLYEDAKSAQSVAIYATAQAQYLAWDAQGITLTDAPVYQSLWTIPNLQRAYFLIPDYNAGVMKTHAEYDVYACGSLTLPALPEVPHATPLGWNLEDPTNDNAVMGTYQPGDLFSMETLQQLEGGSQTAAYFVANYDYEAAQIRVTGTGKQQTLSAKTGQSVNITIAAETEGHYRLFDSNAIEQEIQYTRDEAGATVLQCTATDSLMYLCMTEAVGSSAREYLRICSLEDLCTLRDLINSGTVSDTAQWIRAESSPASPDAYDLILKTDLDMKSVCSVNAGSWTPIAAKREDGSRAANSITLRGEGHFIEHLYICNTSDAQGLFGSVPTLSITELSMNGVVQGNDHIGAFVGECDSFTAILCGSLVSVTGETNAGGFVGTAHNNVQCTFCYSARSVLAKTENAGMFYGRTPSASLIGGYCYGTLKGVTAACCFGNATELSGDRMYCLDTLPDSERPQFAQTLTKTEFADGTALAALRADAAAIPLTKKPAWVQGVSEPEIPMFGTGTYNLFIEPNGTGGKISCEKTAWAAGDYVTITIAPQTGIAYEVTACGASTSTPLPIDSLEHNQVGFYMPQEDVNVQITFTTEAISTLRGDVDCNGSVELADAILLARYIAEDTTLTISQQGVRNCYVNEDDTVDSLDLTTVLRILAKLEA